MRVLVDRRRLVTWLAAVQIGDAVFNAIPTQWLRDDLDHLGIPQDLRAAFPVIKGASAAGLLAGLKWPALGRLTERAMVAYFLLAMAFHARAKDEPLKFLPAIGMLGWSAAAWRAYPVPGR
jgi:hypothetical protein